MVEMEDRELLLASLKGYLEELRDTGVDELTYGEPAASVPSPVPAARETAAGSAAAEPVAAAPPRAGAAESAAAQPEQEPAGITARGGSSAKLVFVLTGPVFAGPSGELFANIVKAMGFTPESAHFLSIDPQAAAPALGPALRRRISAVAPDAVVVLGEQAAQLLLGSAEPIGKLRGRFLDLDGVAVMASLHPDQMQADPSLKRQVWHEMQQVIAHIGTQELKR
jgi:DNA polymerase